MRTILAGTIGGLLFALCGAASAQTSPDAGRGKAPPRESAPSLCEGLAGVERDRCFAEERRQREALGRPDTPRSCDELFGPEKILCLKNGGRIKADVDAGSAAGGSGRR
jgi:hypothetical protein